MEFPDLSCTMKRQMRESWHHVRILNLRCTYKKVSTTQIWFGRTWRVRPPVARRGARKEHEGRANVGPQSRVDAGSS